ncbi:FkbM family methyltransferase [Hyphomonas sp. WL0036]|uniref:FkbM family methyltransferase n=1 Tax=Hyphomonas sediminis TaxID=2866160 RepID=UPI001C8223A3|nr:FkbM family methyltransferase [Hyphomonas sediminis]
MQRHPLKTHSFRVLKEMGVPVETVIDVGILSSTYELIHAYGTVPQILIEPIVEFEDRIRATYDKHKVNYELIKVAASDSDGEALMRTSSVRDGVDITHARMTEDETIAGSYRTVPKRKVDTLVAERNLAKPYLLKIDVDGAELEILKGAENTLKDCSVICIETSPVNFYQRSEAIRKHGFQLFDLVDICYYNNRLIQMDAIFVKTDIILERKLEIYRDGFDISKWNAYDPK